jgi:CDP-paratose 2-epimerase
LELFAFLESELSIKLNYKNLPPRESDQKVFVANITKVSEGLGWRPSVSKEDGIRMMIDWVRSWQNKV